MKAFATNSISLDSAHRGRHEGQCIRCALHARAGLSQLTGAGHAGVIGHAPQLFYLLSAPVDEFRLLLQDIVVVNRTVGAPPLKPITGESSSATFCCMSPIAANVRFLNLIRAGPNGSGLCVELCVANTRCVEGRCVPISGGTSVSGTQLLSSMQQWQAC